MNQVFILNEDLVAEVNKRSPFSQVVSVDFYEDVILIADIEGGIHFTDMAFRSIYDFHISQPIKSVFLVNESESFISFANRSMIHFDRSKFFDWKKDYQNKEILYFI